MIKTFITNIKKPVVAISLIATLVGGILFCIAIWKYTANEYNALDVAIFNNVFQQTIHGNLFGSSIHPPTYLADHVSPIILVIAPLYAILPHPFTLVGLQIIALLSASIPLYFIAKKYLSPQWSMGIALLWILNPFVHNIALFEFHLLPFAVVAIMWAAFGYATNRWWVYVISIVVALLVREDVALVTALFGVIAWIDKKPWRYRLTPLLMSAVYFCVALYIGSLFSDGSYKFLIYYSWLGNSWSEIAFTALTNPWLVISRLVSPGSVLLVLALLLPWCLLPLVRTKWLFLGSLIFVQLVTGTAWQNLGVVLYTQYANLLLPGVALAAIESIAAIQAMNKKEVWQKFFLDQRAIALVLVTATAYTGFTLGPAPGSVHAMATENKKSSDAIINLIPKDASVCASDRLLTALSSRLDICALTYAWVGVQQFGSTPYTIPPGTQYITLDTNDLLTYQVQYQHNPLYADAYASSSTQWATRLNDYGIVAIDDTTLLFALNETSTISLIDTVPAPSSNPVSITESLSFVNADAGNRILQTWWHVDQPLQTLYRLQVTLLAGEQERAKQIYPLGYDLLAGKTGDFRIIYYPSFLQNTPPGVTAVRLQLITIEKGGVELTSWRSSRRVIDRQTSVGQPIDILLTQ